jgi:hypothetical protein
MWQTLEEKKCLRFSSSEMEVPRDWMACLTAKDVTSTQGRTLCKLYLVPALRPSSIVMERMLAVDKMRNM